LTTFSASAQPVQVPYARRELLAFTTTDFSWHDDARNRDVPARVYFPKNTDQSYPVILFSHGLGGTRMNYRYLGKQWASQGFISVHLQHIGSDDSAWRGQARPMEALRQAANYENALARAVDVKFAIDQLEKLNSEGEWRGRLDLNHIGMSGHSFGGQTTFLVGGQTMARRSFADPRIKAIIPMSPAVPELGDLDLAYQGVKVPTFVMTGTEDNSPIGSTQAGDRRKPFDHLPADTSGYLLIFNGGDHMVFSGRPRAVEKKTDAVFQRFIRISTTAFWDSYLKNDDAAKKWLHDGEFAKELGESGALEQKN
jgi:predicted dienelactone hydrolase